MAKNNVLEIKYATKSGIPPTTCRSRGFLPYGVGEPSVEALVSAVFNPDYTVKNCGREACRTLILELQKLYPTLNFGNEKTGILNVDVIRLFLQKL